ncbi:MAG: T9SS type A sorting domain-containing protein [Bacteroidota bacterium]
MKKIYTLLAAMLLLGGVAMAQNSTNSMLMNGMKGHPLPANFKDNSVHQSKHHEKSGPISFWIDIDSADKWNQFVNIGNNYSSYLWDANMHYTLADSSYRFFTVSFDTLIDSYNVVPTGYSSSLYDSVKVDSLAMLVGQENNSGNDDTLICKIGGINSHGYPTSTIYWTDTLIIPFNAPLSPSSWVGDLYNLHFAPNIQLPTNRFCVTLEYHGNLLDTFGVVIGFPSPGTCSQWGGAPYATHSSCYPNTFYYNTGVGHITPDQNGIDSVMYRNCDGNYYRDSSSFIQNAMYRAYVELSGSSTVCSGFSATLNPTAALCSTCADGWVSCTPTGGTSPYTFHWSNGATSQNATGLLPGNYTVTITDAASCVTSQSATITDANVCSATFLLYPDTAAHTYWIVNQSHGQAPIHYDWNWGDASTHDTIAYPTHTYAAAGNYTITLSITDAIGCSTSYTNSYYLQRTSNSMISVHVIQSTGINEINNTNKIMVYPNPAKNTIAIHQSISSANEQVIITDIMGHEVYKAPLTGIDNTIELTKWSNGVYFYEVKSEKESIRGKFIKQ